MIANRTWSIARTFLAGAALLSAACGPVAKDDPTPDAGTPPEETPLFLVHSAVQTGGTRMNYFSLAESVGEAKELDYAKSIELAGRPRLYAAKGFDFFAIGGGESPTITRYDVQDGALVEGDSVSLQPFGVTSLGAQAMLFVSPTKAYYKDDAQAQIIVINPASMEVVKTIQLSRTLVKEGVVTSLSAWASRDGEAFFTVGWSSAQYDRVQPGTVLVRIDTATDTLTEQPLDDRCRGISKTGRLGDTLYFFSSVINGLGHAVNGADDGGQQDCILRVSKGSATFDTDYVGTLATALGEGKEGTVITVGDDGEAWVQVADLSVTPNAAGTTYNQWYSAGWSWWHLPLATLTGAEQVAGEPGAYSGFTLATGSNFYVSRAAADYSISTLVDLSSGTPVDGLSFAGFVLDVARVR